MVPKRLGEDLCSLHGNVDRLAFSCIWVMDEEANIYSIRFEKTVICSAAALSYEEAQVRRLRPRHLTLCSNDLVAPAITRTISSRLLHRASGRTCPPPL